MSSMKMLAGVSIIVVSMSVHADLTFKGPQSCESVFLSNALNRNLKWDDDAIRNELSANTAWVVCPVEFNPAITSTVQVSPRIGYLGSGSATAFCYLKEIDGGLNTIQTVSASKDIPSGYTGTLSLELVRRDILASVSLTCRIPADGQLGDYSVFTTQ